MNRYREWIIQYDGDLKKALARTDTRVHIISERYARCYKSHSIYYRAGKA